MRYSVHAAALTGAAMLVMATPGQAAVVAFQGSATALGVVLPDASCAPRGRGTINPATSSGTSNLGSFTYAHQVCTSGPPGGPINGNFQIAFANDGFFGTLAGVSGQSANDPQFFDFNIGYTVLGGTGRFLGATGLFGTGPGSGADIRFRPSRITLNFQNGVINAPAIPEPGTWALLILGFGVIGGSLRRRPARPALSYR